MNSNKIYRSDIDGLRAIAVVSVIIFHLGFLRNGYLGVDIFFVISGYLITGISFNELSDGKFSILSFYERRIRRIIPLVLVTTTVAFVLGLFFMLPDDLENLSQSVFASNFSVNNILMKITSADYWAVKNDYKPLMHTWSLGVEEQFYLLYPFIFFYLDKGKKNFILPLLIFLSILSLFLFLSSSNTASKFYFLQYRFFELAVGGICAIYFTGKENFINERCSSIYLYTSIIILILIIYFNPIKSNEIKVVITVLFTAVILVTGNFFYNVNSLYKSLFSNKLITFIGKISFSLYLWHQIVFAFTRYFVVDEISIIISIILITITIILSVLSYYLIENPFRNKSKFKAKPLLISLAVCLFFITASSLYVYMIGGVIKNIPELGINEKNRNKKLNFFSSQNNIHIEYNENVRKLNKPFLSDTATIMKKNKIKVLVIGDSYGRDFANILLSSSFREKLEISYSDLQNRSADELRISLKNSDFIFFGGQIPPSMDKVFEYNLDTNKLWIIGTKDFGNSNGLHYNRKIKNYSAYTTVMKSGVLKINNEYKSIWGDKYIDLIELIKDHNEKVLVFTPDGKFISQDTNHLTEFGAIYFAQLLELKLAKILKLL